VDEPGFQNPPGLFAGVRFRITRGHVNLKVQLEPVCRQRHLPNNVCNATRRAFDPDNKLAGRFLALFTRCSAIILDDANLPVRFYVGALHFRKVPDALLSKLTHYLLGRN
jgi:hypothetical protein